MRYVVLLQREWNFVEKRILIIRINDNMKILLVTSKDTFEFDEIDIPKPTDYEVLVKHEGCLICNHTDWMIVDDLFQTPDYPVCIGHESFGKVIEVGSKVRNFKIGDRVICSNAIPTGFDGKRYSTWGGFAEYGIAGDYEALIQDNQTTDGKFSYRKRYIANYKIDNELPLDKAGLVFPLSETASCIKQVPEVKNADVAVFGTGTAGYTMALFSKLGGAKTVTLFGRRLERAEYALDLGADFAYTSDFAYNSDKKYDVVFEVTGNSGVFEKGLPFLKENGVLAVYGVSTSPYKIDFNNTPVSFIKRTVSPDIGVGETIEFVEKMLREDKIPVNKILTHKWDFSDVEKAFRQVKNKEVIKGIIVF